MAKSVAAKAAIFMQIGETLCQMVDESGILVKPKRKPRVVKKAKKKAKVEKATIKKTKPTRPTRNEEDEIDEDE